MRKYIALFLALIVALSAGAALAEADVTGQWYMYLGGAAAELSLNSDGTYRLAIPLAEEKTGTWKLDDGFIYLDGAAAPDLATWGEGTLMLGDNAAFFTREKPWVYAPADLFPDAPPALLNGYWVCKYVDVNGSPLPAGYAADRTDLYVEGHSAILGGPVLGDVIVKLVEQDGSLATGEDSATAATLALQQDGLLRLTVTGSDSAPQTWYLAQASSPLPDGEEEPAT